MGSSYLFVTKCLELFPNSKMLFLHIGIKILQNGGNLARALMIKFSFVLLNLLYLYIYITSFTLIPYQVQEKSGEMRPIM